MMMKQTDAGGGDGLATAGCGEGCKDDDGKQADGGGDEDDGGKDEDAAGLDEDRDDA